MRTNDIFRRPLGCLLALFVAAVVTNAWGAPVPTLAPLGCPISHCTPGATGVIGQPIADSTSFIRSTNGIGSLHGEGCSGNGTRLACLFLKDKSGAARKGTLKMLNATSLTTIWGSGAAANSYDLDANTAALGQVPVVFANGSVAAGDGTVEVLYGSGGAVLGKLSLSGRGTNYGLSPVAGGLGVVSQGSGPLTLIDLTAWQNVGSLQLLDPVTAEPLNLVGPSASSADTVYAVAHNASTGAGFLFAIGVDAVNRQMTVRATFSFFGASGAAPVVVPAAASGLELDLVLLHAPQPAAQMTVQDRLLGISDSGTALTQLWAIELPGNLPVSPTFDAVSQTLFYEYGASIWQSSLASGAPLQKFNLRQIGSFDSSFKLNGHLVASDAGGVFTLLLGGSATVAGSAGGQFVLAFQPLAAPAELLWAQKIADVAANYSGAWNFSQATQSGAACPIAISITGYVSTLTRLCDH